MCEPVFSITPPALSYVTLSVSDIIFHATNTQTVWSLTCVWFCLISRAVVQTAGRAADKQDCGSSRWLDCLKKLTVVASLFVTDRKPSSSESFAQKWAQMSLCCCQKTCSCKTDSFPTTDTLNASQYKRNSQQSHSHLFSLCCYFSHEFILLFLKSSSFASRT